MGFKIKRKYKSGRKPQMWLETQLDLDCGEDALS